MKIKFKLLKFDNQVLFQILEQDLLPNAFIKATEYLTIKSLNVPELGETTLYIRGFTKGSDKRVCIRNFRNNTERDLYYDKILDTFNAINENKV